MACKYTRICLIGLAFISACNSAFVDTLNKCSYKDGKCVANLMHTILKDISKDGIPEIDIPPVDPIYLKNMSIPIAGILKISLENIQVRGIQDCVFNDITNDFVKGVTNMDLTCNLSLKAKFMLDELAPFIQSLLGVDVIRADGNVKLKLEKVNLKMNFFYHIAKKNDGEIYVICHEDEFSSSFEIGNLRINANNIFVGDQDLSDVFVTFVNQNWKLIMPTVGQEIFEVCMTIFSDIFHRFFRGVPARYYISDDLTPLIRN